MFTCYFLLQSEDESESPMSFVHVEDDGPELLSEEYLPLINKVRTKCKQFRKSGLKYETYLQDLVIKAHGKELTLVIDCRTRWNTLVAMLKRFLLLHNEVRTATILSKEVWEFSESEIQTLNDLCQALEPIELAINLLGERSRCLIGAETIYSYTIDTLNKQSTNIARSLKSAFIKRITSRRNPTLIHLMMFLKEPTFWLKNKDYFGEKIVQREIKLLASNLVQRLFPEYVTSSESGNLDDSNDMFKSSENSDLTHEERLKRLLEDDAGMNVSMPSDNDKPSTIGEVLMNYARDPRNMPAILVKLNGALKTIKPSSIESERVFSTCGIFVTKLRTRMNDDTLHSLVFLNKRYKNGGPKIQNKTEKEKPKTNEESKTETKPKLIQTRLFPTTPSSSQVRQNPVNQTPVTQNPLGQNPVRHTPWKTPKRRIPARQQRDSESDDQDDSIRQDIQTIFDV